jgi:YcaO cyclodehydratase, ATP-ad Mg2+-binding
MQGIERYCGIFQGDEIRTTRRVVDFPAGDAILPNDILLLSEAQLDGTSRSAEGRVRRFDPSAETEWSPVWSLRDERFKYLPTGLLYFFHDASAIIRSVPIRTVARPAIRLRKRSSKVSSNSSSGMPTRSGGTIACNVPRLTSIS